MAPRYCKKCEVAFHGTTCRAGHPIFLLSSGQSFFSRCRLRRRDWRRVFALATRRASLLSESAIDRSRYSKTIPEGVEIDASSSTRDLDEDDCETSPLKPAAQGGAAVHKKVGETASSLDLSTVSSDGKEAQRELDRSIALVKTTERVRAQLVKKKEPMMVAIDALKRAVAEDSAYKKASAEQSSERLLTVIASYRFAIGLATEVTQSPKSKASVVKQLSEKIESVKTRLSKLEAALEEGSDDALAAAEEQVRAAAGKDDIEKIDATVAKRMESWDSRWEQEWLEAHASGRRGALSGAETAGLPTLQSEQDSEEGFHSVAASPVKPQAIEAPSEVREAAENLREVAAPADVTGDPVQPPPESLRLLEAAPGPSLLPPGIEGSGRTADLLHAAAAALADQLPAASTTADASPAYIAEPPVPEATAAPLLTAAATVRTERPKIVLSTPAPRPRPARVLAAPYTPAPPSSGVLYRVGDARQYLEASGTLAALSDAFFAIAAEPEESRPQSLSGAVAYLAEKATSGALPPQVEATLTAEVSLTDVLRFDYLSTLAAPVHGALMQAEKERSIDGEPGPILGKLLSTVQLGVDAAQTGTTVALPPVLAAATVPTPQLDSTAEPVAMDDSV